MLRHRGYPEAPKKNGRQQPTPLAVTSTRHCLRTYFPLDNLYASGSSDQPSTLTLYLKNPTKYCTANTLHFCATIRLNLKTHWQPWNISRCGLVFRRSLASRSLSPNHGRNPTDKGRANTLSTQISIARDVQLALTPSVNRITYSSLQLGAGFF